MLVRHNSLDLPARCFRTVFERNYRKGYLLCFYMIAHTEKGPFLSNFRLGNFPIGVIRYVSTTFKAYYLAVIQGNFYFYQIRKNSISVLTVCVVYNNTAVFFLIIAFLHFKETVFLQKLLRLHLGFLGGKGFFRYNSVSYKEQ